MKCDEFVHFYLITHEIVDRKFHFGQIVLFQTNFPIFHKFCSIQQFLLNLARYFFTLYIKRQCSIVCLNGLGFDKTLLHRFSTVLKAISCGNVLDVKAFKNYCYETAELFVSKYEWYPMPTFVHIVLMHGASMVNQFTLPIGWLDEEPVETINKIAKMFRLHHARKTSRLASNKDVFNRLLINSDPYFSSKRPIRSRKVYPLDGDLRS